MAKLRVYQLARELNRDNAEIIRELQHMGVPVTSHSNTVEDRLADRLRRELGVYVPEAEKTAPAADEIVAVEAPEVEASQAPPPEPVPVEVEPPRVEAQAEPKVEPKVEEKAPTPEPKVATPPPPPVTPAPPAPAPKVEQPAAAHPVQPVQPVQPRQPQFTPQGGRIIPPPTRIGPAVPPVIPPPKPEPPQEQRK